MALEGDKWRVVKGDCLWNIAKSVYGNGTKWTEIASANGLKTTGNPIIYPGQLFTLPGITSGTTASTPSATTDPPANTQVPTIQWFSLRAGTTRDMEVIWTQANDKFLVRWEIWDLNGHLWMESESTKTYADEQKADEHSFEESTDRFICRVSIRAVDSDGNNLSDWAYKEYDFRNNPPDLPPDPTLEIDSNNKLTVTFNNIDTDINADSIEVAVYQDNTIKYKTGTVSINTETNYASYQITVDAGHYYKVRARAVRGSIYGGWTNFTDNEQSCPLAPEQITTLRTEVISEQGAKQYGVFVEWPEVPTAKQYELQWTTNTSYFDQSDNVQSQTTEEGQGPRLLVTDIETGHEWFFRVRSINDKGNSPDWSEIKSIAFGSKPSAPTTWSSTSSAVIGEDLNLYWVHNATDGSLEKQASINIIVIDSAHPDLDPMEYNIIVNNEKAEDDTTNSFYTINTNDSQWANLASGYILKWKVKTAGVNNEYSDYSVEREINIYTQPELSLDILSKDDISLADISEFPFYISALATPVTQKPISYYIEVVSNSGYDIVDNVGVVQTINPGDKVYQKYYDPAQNAWRFYIEMTPGNINLKSGVSYTINVTVAMDSGLTATSSQNFDCTFDNSLYIIDGDITINKETLTATIHPYCMEYEEDGVSTKLSDAMLLVYRREYDGSFTLIQSDIDNNNNVYTTDPHPALDYARYRVVAISNTNGSVSYRDIDAVKVGEPSIVLQWSEKYTKFDYNGDMDSEEVPWEGSMIKFPYNVDVTESKSLDVSLIEYAGRQHPVSYYGTQLGETATWNSEIPVTDKETIYALRRLSVWAGDVYVREPSGTGYWANVTVSFSTKHLELTIPITFNIKRVEGGI